MLRTIITSVVLFFVTQSIADGRINIFLRKPNYIFYNILAIFNLYSFFNMLFWNYEINFLIVLVITYILSFAMSAGMLFLIIIFEIGSVLKDSIADGLFL